MTEVVNSREGAWFKKTGFKNPAGQGDIIIEKGDVTVHEDRKQEKPYAKRKKKAAGCQ